MNVVVLTFPGHFFQTVLCLRSIMHCYGYIQPFDILIDDVTPGPWPTYPEDFEYYLKNTLPKPITNFRIHRFSQIESLKGCVSGWWRQQLIKFYIDTILPGNKWFIVDGDVIFDTRCIIEGVTPISVRANLESTPLAQLTANYVKNTLAVEQGHMVYQGQYALTNPIPFRLLTRELLTGLRAHVEKVHQKDFLQLHLDWFDDQTIIAFEDPPTKMIMTEWELIEGYRHFVLKQPLPLLNIGSGYPIYTHTNAIDNDGGIYRHGYKRDTSMDREWFEQQGLPIPDKIWNDSIAWKQAIEPDR